MARKNASNVAATFIPLEVADMPLPNVAASVCVSARRLLDAGRLSDAMRMLEDEADAGRNSAEFQFVLGRAAFRMGDHAGAHRAFSRAVALSPADAEVYRWLARLLVRSGDVLGARRALNTQQASVATQAETPSGQE